MILLRLISWPYFRKHVLRTMLTIAGIVLGVAVFVGMHAANQSVLFGFNQTIDQWFDPSAFAETANFTYGNCGFNTVRGPGSKSMNMSLFRNFPLGAARRLEFRLEAFNLFNWTNYDFPAASVSNPATFGKITSTLGDPRELQLAVKFYF